MSNYRLVNLPTSAMVSFHQLPAFIEVLFMMERQHGALALEMSVLLEQVKFENSFT
jgi:hypothetical protein